MIDDTYPPPWDQEDRNVGSAAPRLSTSDGAELVVSLARWMRFIGLAYIVAAGLAVLALMALSTFGRAAIVVCAISALFAFAVIAAGVWLREAGDQFNRGVTDDDVGILGAGFGNLRKYLILFGVFEILLLAHNLRNLVSP